MVRILNGSLSHATFGWCHDIDLPDIGLPGQKTLASGWHWPPYSLVIFMMNVCEVNVIAPFGCNLVKNYSKSGQKCLDFELLIQFCPFFGIVLSRNHFQLTFFWIVPQANKNSTQIETKTKKSNEKAATKTGKNTDKLGGKNTDKVVAKNTDKPAGKTCGKKSVKKGVGKKGEKEVVDKKDQPLIYEVVGNQKQLKSRKRPSKESAER